MFTLLGTLAARRQKRPVLPASFLCAFSDGIYNYYQLPLEVPRGGLDLEQPLTVRTEFNFP